MRGKAVGGLGPEMPFRITPAHAGKRDCPLVRMDFTWDHPRTCGEKGNPHCKVESKRGSPPHMRGKENIRINTASEARITPAHAGKSDRHRPHPRRTEDHPRTCGEKPALNPAAASALGSPPHMRGKERLSMKVLSRKGITPAHAGKSIRIVVTLKQLEDHPRTCGEKPLRFGTLTRNRGSPPHMRGKETGCLPRL